MPSLAFSLEVAIQSQTSGKISYLTLKGYSTKFPSVFPFHLVLPE